MKKINLVINKVKKKKTKLIYPLMEHESQEKKRQ